jgi:hypothetical protein
MMTSIFDAVEPWQAMLDRHQPMFADMVPGASVGLVRREGSGIQPGKHVGGLASAGGEIPMMLWTVVDGGMVASLVQFRGLADIKVDLLLVVGDRAVGNLATASAEERMPMLKRLIRSGDVLFFVFRTKFELQDAGYEDFLDTLGLAFLGACR